MIKVVHYLNQFYAGIGGEDKADIRPVVKEGLHGPGVALKAALGQDAEIVATITCGDSYFNENMESAVSEILQMISAFNPDLFIAGPAFNAGRYGVACGAVCKAVSEQLKIPVLTGMYPENPGVDMFRKDIYIVQTANAASGMKPAISAIAKLAVRLAHGEIIGSPTEEGYIPRGLRRNVFKKDRGSKRAVDMLIAKLKNNEFETEYPMPDFDRVAPNQPVKDMAKARIALVTSGGIVPKGNPDRIESSSASKYGRYDITGVDDLTSVSHETAHGGYDPVYANQDADRVLPVDILRDLEKEDVIGHLFKYYYATVGNGTSVSNAKKYAASIARELVENNIDAVILTST